MPFGQEQGAFGDNHGVRGAEHGGNSQPQAPMMQREEQFQHAIRPGMVHVHMPPVMRDDAEHRHIPGGNAGSAHGTAHGDARNAAEPHEDIFTRMQRQAAGSRRMSRAGTEESRGRGGRGDGLGDGPSAQQ